VNGSEPDALPFEAAATVLDVAEFASVLTDTEVGG
jgi:hypothetical protein